ncbi:MAG: hypothetical protein R3C24_10895 [Cyanobacteriota/Melainabacteria group bacterium]
MSSETQNFGRTAPVVINEHESIADGNHRLTAAWLWNLLNASVKTCWKIDDTNFKAIADFIIEGHKGEISPVTIQRCRTPGNNSRGRVQSIFSEDQIVFSRCGDTVCRVASNLAGSGFDYL